jgi:hypothetical protein
MDADDYFAIQKLIYTYPQLLDRGEIEAMAELFAHATVQFPAQPPIHADAAAVGRAYRDFLRIYPDGTPRTRHVMANLIIEPDGADRARSTSCVMVFQQTAEFRCSRSSVATTRTPAEGRRPRRFVDGGSATTTSATSRRTVATASTAGRTRRQG